MLSCLDSLHVSLRICGGLEKLVDIVKPNSNHHNAAKVHGMALLQYSAFNQQSQPLLARHWKIWCSFLSSQNLDNVENGIEILINIVRSIQRYIKSSRSRDRGKEDILKSIQEYPNLKSRLKILSDAAQFSKRAGVLIKLVYPSGYIEPPKRLDLCSNKSRRSGSLDLFLPVCSTVRKKKN